MSDLNYVPRYLWYSKRLDDVTELVQLPGAINDHPVYRVVDPELKTLVIEFLQIYVCGTKNFNAKRFPGSVPASLMKSELSKLLTGKFMVGEKLKGTHYRLVALKLCSEKVLSQSFKREKESKAPITIKQLRDAKQRKTRASKSYEGYKNQRTEQTDLTDITEQTEEAEDNEKSDTDDNEVENNKGMNEEESKDVAGTEDSGYEKDEEMNRRKKIESMQEMIALVNRKNEIFVVPYWTLKESAFPAVLSGELAYNNKTEQDNFLVFNISMCNRYLYSSFLFQDRVRAYTEFILLTGKTHSSAIPILAKPQFNCHHFEKVILRATKGEYDCDGIILNNNSGPMTEIGTDRGSYKVKWHHTIDVAVRITSSTTLDIFIGSDKFELIVDGSQSIISFTKHLTHTPDRKELESRIWECSYDTQNTEYTAIIAREDKSEPNFYKIVEFTKQNIIENITPETLTRFWIENRCNAQIEEQIEKQNECLSLMQNVRYKINHPEQYVQDVLNDSNYKIENISSETLSIAIRSVDLSWDRSLFTLPQTTTAVENFNDELQEIESITEEDLQELVNSKGLKCLQNTMTKKTRRKLLNQPIKKLTKKQKRLIEERENEMKKHGMGEDLADLSIGTDNKEDRNDSISKNLMIMSRLAKEMLRQSCKKQEEDQKQESDSEIETSRIAKYDRHMSNPEIEDCFSDNTEEDEFKRNTDVILFGDYAEENAEMQEQEESKIQKVVDVELDLDLDFEIQEEEEEEEEFDEEEEEEQEEEEEELEEFCLDLYGDDEVKF